MNWKTCILISAIGLIAVTAGQAATWEDYAPYMHGTAYVDAYVVDDTNYNIWPTAGQTDANGDPYTSVTQWLQFDTAGAPFGFWYYKGTGQTGNPVSSKAIDGTAFQGSDSDYPPELTFTMTGLDDTKTYDVYVVHWPKLTSWCAYVALPGHFFRQCHFQQASTIADDTNFFYDGGTGVQGCEFFMGQVSGQTGLSMLVDVAIDTPSDDRCWFDGVSYREAEPRAEVTLTINPPIVLDPGGWGYSTLPGEFPIVPPIGAHTFLQGQTVTLEAPQIVDSATGASFVNCPDYFTFVGWEEGTPGDPNVKIPQTSTGEDNPNYYPWIHLTASETLTPVFQVVEFQGVCGDDCHPFPMADFNSDCIVDLMDFAIISRHWLECTQPECD
ncbi:MAG: hypothetical protein JW709_11375 [Sedimentisphaerales bacterium]|nr:hypothetical protein [Sedimentisphaerales bacterium]